MKYTSATPTLLACFVLSVTAIDVDPARNKVEETAAQLAIDKLFDTSKLARDVLAGVSITTSGVGDGWEEQLACTVAGLSDKQPTIVDSAACATTKAAGQACVWCEGISKFVGTGVCVSSSQKDMAGQFWEMVCGTSSVFNKDLNPARITDDKLEMHNSFLGTSIISQVEKVAESALHKPVGASKLVRDEQEVASNPVLGGDWEEQLACTVDGLSDQQPTIVDSAACAITKDTAGQACVWCEGISKFLGTGMCLSPSQKDMVGQFWDMLCGTSSRSNQLEDRTKTNLRGAEMKLRDWKQLDPTCLGSTSGLNTSKNCGTSQDAQGEQCVWCDGAGVLGMCVSPVQKSFLANYLDCQDQDVSGDIAVSAE